MLKYIRRLGAPLALSAAFVAAACGGDARKGSDSALAQDSALSRDLQMANNADSATQPALQDVPAPVPAPEATTPARPATRPPAATRPRTSTPAKTPPAATKPAPATTASGNTVTPGSTGSEKSVGSIAAGTVMTLTSASKVCTNTNHVGDRMTATLSEAVSGSNGVSIPAGATVTLEVTKLSRSENAKDPIQMGFAVRSVTFNGRTYALDADVTSATVDRVRGATKSDDAKKVIGGAVAGAILGQIIGKNTKGTVIGAATGAAAGAAGAAATANYEGCVNQGGRITVKLNSAATVQAS